MDSVLYGFGPAVVVAADWMNEGEAERLRITASHPASGPFGDLKVPRTARFTGLRHSGLVLPKLIYVM